MLRAQLRADFERSMQNSSIDFTREQGQNIYKDFTTQLMWLTWVVAFETYTNEPIVGLV